MKRKKCLIVVVKEEQTRAGKISAGPGRSSFLVACGSNPGAEVQASPKHRILCRQ